MPRSTTMSLVTIRCAVISMLVVLSASTQLSAFDLPEEFRPKDAATMQFEAGRVEPARTWAFKYDSRDRDPVRETRDSKLATLGTLMIADYFQTVQFLYQVPSGYTSLGNIYPNGTTYRFPDGRTYTVSPGETLRVPVYRSEVNPVLGEYPSRGQLLAFGVASVALTAAAAYLLPAPWGDRVLNVVMYTEMNNVKNNNDLLVGRGMVGIPIVLTFKFPISWL